MIVQTRIDKQFPPTQAEIEHLTTLQQVNEINRQQQPYQYKDGEGYCYVKHSFG